VNGTSKRYDGEPSTGKSWQILVPFISDPKLVVEVTDNGVVMPGEQTSTQAVSPSQIQCIQDVSNYFNVAQGTYSILFHNSNQYVQQTLTACGLNPGYSVP
jgi:hypothetical protein